MMRVWLPGGRRIGVRVKRLRGPSLLVSAQADGDQVSVQVEGTFPKEEVPDLLVQIATDMRLAAIAERHAQGRVN